MSAADADVRQVSMGVRARAVLDAIAAAEHGKIACSPTGHDVGRLQVFKRDARADMWLIGPRAGFELHLTVRDFCARAAFLSLKDMVNAIWPEARP